MKTNENLKNKKRRAAAALLFIAGGVFANCRSESPPPNLRGEIIFSGAAMANVALTFTSTAGADAVYTWYIDDAPIAEGASYTPVKNDIGKEIVVKAVRKGYTGEVLALTNPVGKEPGLYEAANDYPEANTETLDKAMLWLAASASAGTPYTAVLGADEASAGRALNAAAFGGAAGVKLALEGSGRERKLQLTQDNAALWTVSSGYALILNNFITLAGIYNSASHKKPIIEVTAGGSLEMNNGSKLTGNAHKDTSTEVNAGAVTVDDAAASFTMNGGEISGNEGYRGGGVAVGHGASFTANGGVIQNNVGIDNSGAIYFLNANNNIINNISLLNNVSKKTGGAVQLFQSSLTINNCTVMGNTADNPNDAGGGGFFLALNSALTFNGGVIMSNTTTSTAFPNSWNLHRRDNAVFTNNTTQTLSEANGFMGLTP